MTTYDIEVLRGNAFNGAQFVVTLNGVALSLVGQTLTMDIRSDPSSSLLLATLSIGAGLTVDDAANGVFHINSQIFPLLPGTYFYDILILPMAKTYIMGTITIGEDVTWT